MQLEWQPGHRATSRNSTCDGLKLAAPLEVTPHSDAYNARPARPYALNPSILVSRRFFFLRSRASKHRSASDRGFKSGGWQYPEELLILPAVDLCVGSPPWMCGWDPTPPSTAWSHSNPHYPEELVQPGFAGVAAICRSADARNRRDTARGGRPEGKEIQRRERKGSGK